MPVLDKLTIPDRWWYLFKNEVGVKKPYPASTKGFLTLASLYIIIEETLEFGCEIQCSI